MAQSATVTGRGGSAGGHSMRTWTSGRFGVPPMRRSASSSPDSSTRARNDSTRLSESIKKSAGPTSPASPNENLVPARPVSSRHAEVGDHPPVAPTRGPMREELRAIVRAAPRRARDLRQAEPLRLAGEQHAATARGVAVHAVQDKPTVVRLAMPADRTAVHLVAEDDGAERRAECGPERAPARHHLAHAFLAPEAEGEAPPESRLPAA